MLRRASRHRRIAVILAGCGGAILIVVALAYLFAFRDPAISSRLAAVLERDGGNEDRVTLTHQRGSVVLNIASGRPMAKAAEALMKEYGYTITYEDPRYEYADDLIDVSGEIRRDGRSGRQDARYAVWVPKTHRAVIVLPEPKSQDDIDAALAKVASAFPGGGGRFDIERASGVVHVIPRDVRDRNGNWINRGSVLDNRISIPNTPRSDLGLIAAICDAVSTTAGVEVSVGMGIGGGLMSVDGPPQYELGANSERARDVLVRALTLIGHGQMRQTWFMFYGNMRTDNLYAMNFRPAPNRAEMTGRQAARQVDPHAVPQMGYKTGGASYWHN